MAFVGVLLACVLAVAVALGCAGSDDNELPRAGTDASAKPAPESSAGDSGARADAPRRRGAREAPTNTDGAGRPDKPSRKRHKEDVLAALGLGGGGGGADDVPNGQNPRMLLRALEGKRPRQRSEPRRDTGLPAELDQLLGGGGERSR